MAMPPRQPIVEACHIDPSVAIEDYRNGGIFHTVLRSMAKN